MAVSSTLISVFREILAIVPTFDMSNTARLTKILSKKSNADKISSPVCQRGIATTVETVMTKLGDVVMDGLNGVLTAAGDCADNVKDIPSLRLLTLDRS